MILFEANAVAPLVKLPDAAVEETVHWEMVGLMTISARRKAPPLQKPKDGPLNFKGEEKCGSGKTSGLSRIFNAIDWNIGAWAWNRVYNAGNLFASSRLTLNDCAIWRHDGDSCSE
jgi:hypothetical protein